MVQHGMHEDPEVALEMDPVCFRSSEKEKLECLILTN